MDLQKIRKDFPILNQAVNGYPLIYLDNAATTQKPRCVIDKIAEFYNNSNSNIHRGVHHLSQKATSAYEEARSYVARYMDAGKDRTIVFTKGTTESINLVASSFSILLSAKDTVVTTVSDHHSSFVPWQQACLKTGAKFKVVSLLPDGSLDLEQLRNLLAESPKILILPHVSNVIGRINPVKEIIAEAHRHGTAVLVDGAQAIAHIPVSTCDIDADFYAFSAHKMYGPVGVGVLYGKRRFLDAMPPYQGGGEMIGHVSFDKTTFADLPFKFEAGTPDYVGSTALAKALDYVSAIGMDRIAGYEQDLTAYAINRLREIPGMHIFGNASERGGVISFLVGQIHPFDMGTLLDRLGIAVRTGHHCAEPLMKRLGIEGTVRISIGLYNTKEEVDELVKGIERVCKMF